MNASQTMILSAAKSLLRSNGVVCMSSGGSFAALISRESEIDPGAPLGEDLREVLFMDVLRDDDPELDAQSSVTVDGVDMVASVRINNVGDPFVRYKLVKP